MGVIGSIMEERVTFFFFPFPSLPFRSKVTEHLSWLHLGIIRGSIKQRVTFPSLAWSGVNKGIYRIWIITGNPECYRFSRYRYIGA